MNKIFTKFVDGRIKIKLKKTEKLKIFSITSIP